MVQSNASNVDDYMANVEPGRVEALARLRHLCRDRLPGWGERMQWGMPGYGPPGADPVVSFNSQKNYLAFYPGSATVTEFADRLSGLDCGKGCVRYKRPEQMDFDLISEMLDSIRQRGGPMC